MNPAGFVTEKLCDERRDSCKDARIARDDVICEATKIRDLNVEKLETRLNAIIILILVQLLGFVLGLIALLISKG